MRNPTRTQLANALKKKRASLSWGVRKTAKELGISPSTYSRIENAKQMTLETYFRAVEWVHDLLPDNK